METSSRKRYFVIIVAAGSGHRMSSNTPKQYMKIAGKELLRWSVESFSSMSFIDHVCVVISKDHMELYEKSVSGLDISKHVFGGNSRQESVYKGLKSLEANPDDIVLIHDAARPLVNEEDIKALAYELKNHLAATLASKTVYTTVCEESGNIECYIDRGSVYSLHTPQGFRFGTLLEAHEHALKFEPERKYTDDTSIVQSTGVKVKLVECSSDNIKITGRKDFEMVENILSSKKEIRSGTGFDVHAFKGLQDNQGVRICGIDVPYDRSLEGHSDADVALHALCDALLGACGEGDIGDVFPPSEERWKGADSSIFVKEACRRINIKLGNIINVDITIICQEPRISKYKSLMRSKVSEILNIEAGRVNIKATTTEGLGFTGRCEGIASQACASVEFPEQKWDK